MAAGVTGAGWEVSGVEARGAGWVVLGVEAREVGCKQQELHVGQQSWLK